MEHDVHVHKLFDITEPALVEHRHGYVFLRSGLNLESMTYWDLDSGPRPKAFRDYLLWRAGRNAAAHLPVAVSLRARWEGNFWHFHDNVLSKLTGSTSSAWRKTSRSSSAGRRGSRVGSRRSARFPRSVGETGFSTIGRYAPIG